MGYYSSVCASLEFASEEKAMEFTQIPDREAQTGDNPFYMNCGIDKISGVYYLGLEDSFVKMNDYKIWIPWLAKWVRGEIEVTGEEPGDNWKVMLFGNGSYQCYSGRIEYDSVPIAVM